MSDKNYLSFADEEVGAQSLGPVIPPPEFAPWSDTLKFSNAWNGQVTAEVVQGGLEDCADFNRTCSSLDVHADEWRSGGQYVSTIKGGCKNITLSGLVTVKGQVVDVDLDNYSDQNHSPSENISLRLWTNNGSPIVWRSWLGTKPTILNPEQAYRCAFRLPWIIGIIVNRVYQLLKILHICA